MTYTLSGQVCAYCGFKIMYEQLNLVPKTGEPFWDKDSDVCIIVTVHNACKKPYMNGEPYV